MTQKKSIASKLLLAAIALTLISFCFLGSTFARYTSSNGGSASLNVAKWDVSMGEGSILVNFGQLSPSMAEYDDADASAPDARSKVTEKKLVATISNNGDVDANITINFGNEKVTKGGVANYGDGITVDGTGNPTEQNVLDLFEIKLYYGTTEGAENATTGLTPGQTVALTTESKIYVYAEVIWTSADVSYWNYCGADEAAHTSAAVMADALDTWVGKNVTSVGYDISYTAVQNSELPPKASA